MMASGAQPCASKRTASSRLALLASACELTAPKPARSLDAVDAAAGNARRSRTANLTCRAIDGSDRIVARPGQREREHSQRQHCNAEFHDVRSREFNVGMSARR